MTKTKEFLKEGNKIIIPDYLNIKFVPKEMTYNQAREIVKQILSIEGVQEVTYLYTNKS